jgi:endonuclease/exonuclease/phosphatase (EEP) superfamily protein YafD
MTHPIADTVLDPPELRAQPATASNGRVGLLARLRRALIPAFLALLGIEWIGRAVAPDALYLQMGLASGLLYLYLPAYAVGIAAAWRKRWRMLATSGLLCVLHLIDVLPGALVAVPDPPAEQLAAGVTIRAVTANLSYANETMPVLAAEVAAFDADLLCLPEYTPDWVSPIAATTIPQSLPFMVRHTASGPFGMALFSRWEIREERIEMWSGVPAIRAVVAVPRSDGNAREVVVWCCHPPPPRPSMFVLWREWQDAFLAAFKADLAGSRPVIAMGDFNCTPYHDAYRQLLATGARSAHRERGRELSITWGNWEMAPNLIRIDHVFVSEPIAVRSVREGIGAGSDHRPVIAELVLLP